MKKKWMLIAALTVLIALITVAAFRWEARYGGQNAFAIEKAKAALNRGRGYEVLAEGEIYLTDDGHFSDILYFLEGHYGVQLVSFDEESVSLSGDYGDMQFSLTEIESFGKRYFIWERAH